MGAAGGVGVKVGSSLADVEAAAGTIGQGWRCGIRVLLREHRPGTAHATGSINITLTHGTVESDKLLLLSVDDRKTEETFEGCQIGTGVCLFPPNLATLVASSLVASCDSSSADRSSTATPVLSCKHCGGNEILI